MVPVEEVVELLMIIAHRSRIAFDDSCQFEEHVPHEVLLLRALLRAGQGKKGIELARELGWSPGRVSQVIDALVAKGKVERRKTISIVTKGAQEAECGGYLLRDIASKILEGFDDDALATLVTSLRRVAANSEGLWRIRRSAS